MIVKLQKAGSSFKGLASYLTEQKDRVAWTHSLNCANDDVPLVVHEMFTTYSQAELLKQEAGVHAGGSVVKTPVKHISLNWHPDEKPTPEHMIATGEAFLKHMGWDEHQALLVAHNDKPHTHVHIELNRIHPETGKALDDSFERRRASDWALSYERENGIVRCPQREFEYAERTPSPTRETWQKLRDAEDEYTRDEIAAIERSGEKYFERGERKEAIPSREWELLKTHQRAERENFFAEGKIIFKEARNEIYRDVRERYREIWGEYYAACREGLDPGVAEAWKKEIVILQRDMFETLKNEAFSELRYDRGKDYEMLLLCQKTERLELRRDQASGHTSYELLNFRGPFPLERFVWEVEPANQNERSDESAKSAVKETAEPEFDNANDNSARLKDGLSGLSDMGSSLIGGLATFVERLFDSLLDGRPAPAVKHPPPEPNDDQRRRSEALRFQKIEEAIEQAKLERMRQRDDTDYRERQRSRD